MRNIILIVEDDIVQREILRTVIGKNFNEYIETASNGREALNALTSDKDNLIKLVIMDVKMPIMGGMETLGIINQQYPDLPVIMLTGTEDVNHAVEAMKLGAIDFISKPFNPSRLEITINNALKLSNLTKEIRRLKEEKDGVFSFKSLIGHDSGLLESTIIGRKAAASDIPVLLTGETGTGKEVFARAIHGESARKGKPFIAVNCGAIPSQLVESTLFGHEKGAFTGATHKVLGKFREAEGGTIFLDEVGELPLDAQVKLLRVLQQKEVEPVGAGKAIPINVRILSATNRKLEEEVTKRTFREDLFFRLNVLNIDIPPLRDRKKDIAKLARHFVDRYCAEQNIAAKTLSPEALQLLEQRNWPGNVRQLENIIKRAIVMSDSTIIDTDDIKSDTAMAVQIEPSSTENNTVPPDMYLNITLINDDGAFKTTDQIVSEMVQIALSYHNGNVTQAAKSIGIAKSTFYKKMAELKN